MPRLYGFLSVFALWCLLPSGSGLGQPATVPDPSSGTAPSMYERATDLQGTMLATRGRYLAWLGEQPAARKAIALKPWLRTAALPCDEIDRKIQPGKGIDVAAKTDAGSAVWSPVADLVDAKAVKLPAAREGTAFYLTRTIDAKQAVRLTVGLGGGDQLDAWLNGRPVVGAATHIVSGRYGCSYRFDDTRVDQLLVDLDLKPGENRLVVRLTGSEEPSFYFSPAPRPVPRLWEQLRRDFAPAANPLLELVDASWFDAQGWLAAETAEREEQLVAQLADQCADDASPVRAELESLRKAKADATDRRWLDLCVKASVLATLHGDLGRLRAAVESLGRSHAGQYPAAELLARLDDYGRRLAAQARGRLDPADGSTRRLMNELPQLKHEMLVRRNPLLGDTEILFVKRYTYDSKHYYDNFQHISRFGGNLCVYSPADGRVRQLVPELDGGVFDRYDLSFDARRVAFGYRRPKPEGYRIWEVGIDGRGLRQVTLPPKDEQRRIEAYGETSTGDGFYGLLGYHFWTDDVHPCYLPDGGLAFASTRSEHGVLCTPNHYLACTNLFRIDADGGNLRPISRGALSEFTPTMMEDGRILYNRWEYVYKGIAAVQPLWITRPDGSASEEFYGDNIANPGVLWQARQVPGHPRLAVAVGCGHEPLGVGQVLLLDINKGKRTPAAMTSLTPNVRTENLRGLYQRRNGQWREDIYGPFYADPYPLSDKFFLVACNPDRRYNDQAGYGIYLLDAFGNRVPIYRDPEFSCWEPMPLAPRTTPPVLPDQSLAATGDGQPKATVFLSDVYRGLEGVPRGTVKYLRVMEQIAKPWSAEVDPLRGEDRRADGFGGHLVVSHNAHIWIAVLRGIVPVEEDGSAVFEVPADRNLFFQALDADYMQVQRMRTFVNFTPGERRSCIGCHEHRHQAPVSRPTVAMGRKPSVLAAQPGEVAPRPLHYPTDVQPILDRHCTQCHNGDPKAPPDLRGELTTLFNRSYENLFQTGQVDTIREWAGGSYAMQNVEAVAPYQHGSHRSKLVELLRKGHYDAKLAREEWVRLVTWIDCGAPYYGSYYGRRNLQYQGQPDFRPVPTVDSACGIRPAFAEPPRLPPIDARLLARWSLDDASTEKAADTSGGGHDARPVNLARGDDPDRRPSLRFDGRGYLECDSLGAHEAVSIALWVKPESWNANWNPLLFLDDIRTGTLHFSLLPDGTPNVAINTGESNWTHRRASESVPLDAWHHVILVCDARRGGSVQFYVDGQPAGRRYVGLDGQIDLYGFRIGAWNRWQTSPASNFHGRLADVRIYSGILTDDQAARLVKESGKPTP